MLLESRRGPSGRALDKEASSATIVIDVPLDLDINAHYRSDMLARLVRDGLDGRSSVASLLDSIAASYDVHRRTALQDLDELLSKLASEGLLASTGP